ncbi:MAG: hypothetical protein K2K60_00390 [Clostridia bacterium]|nr:hypothetical protein [Clostridia bacterium]
MDIKNKILHYLFVYDGELEGTEKRVKEDLRRELYKPTDTKLSEYFYNAISDLVNKGNIEILPYEDMTTNQRYKFNQEGKTLYRIINKNID